MAYQSWSVVFGEQPSAAKWNILGTNDSSFNDGTGISNLEIGSGHTSLKNDYKFSVYRNAAFTITSTPSVLTCDSKTFDTSTNVDVATNKGRFTAPVAGFYHFSGSCEGATTTNMYCMLYVNGAEVKRGSYANTSSTFMKTIIAATLSLSANDYVELYVVSTSGNSALTVGSKFNWFDGFLISQT